MKNRMLTRIQPLHLGPPRRSCTLLPRLPRLPQLPRPRRIIPAALACTLRPPPGGSRCRTRRRTSPAALLPPRRYLLLRPRTRPLALRCCQAKSFAAATGSPRCSSSASRRCRARRRCCCCFAAAASTAVAPAGMLFLLPSASEGGCSHLYPGSRIHQVYPHLSA